MWRMGKVDYVSAVAQAGERVALEGMPLPTPWDLRLRSAMTSANTAVHEEAVARLLPADIGSCLLLGVGGVLFATGDSGDSRLRFDPRRPDGIDCDGAGVAQPAHDRRSRRRAGRLVNRVN